MFGRSGRKQNNILTVKIAIIKHLEKKTPESPALVFFRQTMSTTMVYLCEVEKSGITFNPIHPQGGMNVLTKFHGDSSNSS